MFSEADVQRHLNRLADEIAAAIDSPAVVNAFRVIPRHRFVINGFYVHDSETHQHKHVTLENTEPQDWLEMVYSNRALMIKLWQTGAPSSSSEPVLMAQMLAALDIQPGMRVLEIGTGTGYNAALLATLVGEQGQVVTIDNQAHLTERAAAVLKEVAGKHVSVYTGDGLDGVAAHAPYDRIIATASYPRVPAMWLEQLEINGKLIMNVGSVGGLALIQKTDNQIEGRFLEQPGYFMPLIKLHAHREQSLEGIDMESLHSMDFRFFASWAMPEVNFYPVNIETGELTDAGALQFRSQDDAHSVRLEPDGKQTKMMILQGEDAFAEKVLTAVRLWHSLEKPKRTDFHLTIEPDGRHIIHAVGDANVRFEL